MPTKKPPAPDPEVHSPSPESAMGCMPNRCFCFDGLPVANSDPKTSRTAHSTRTGAPRYANRGRTTKQITDEIGAARCDSDAQCRTLALGPKPAVVLSLGWLGQHQPHERPSCAHWQKNWRRCSVSGLPKAAWSPTVGTSQTPAPCASHTSVCCARQIPRNKECTESAA